MKGYDTIFAVPICRGLSGTLDSMEMIANQLEMKFVGVWLLLHSGWTRMYDWDG